MHYAIEINAGKTPNGSSRKGWYIYTSDRVLVGFLEAEGIGDHILYRMFPGDVIKLHATKVPVSEWREALRMKQVSAKYPGFQFGWSTDPNGTRYAWSYNSGHDVGLIYYGAEYAEVTASGSWRPGYETWSVYEVLNTYSGHDGSHMLEFDPEAVTRYFIASGHAG